jgi:hypothetical protein
MNLEETIRDRLRREQLPAMAFDRIVERGGPFLCVGCDTNADERHVVGMGHEGGTYPFHRICFDTWKRVTGHGIVLPPKD